MGLHRDVIVKTPPIVGYNFSIYLARCDVDISCTGCCYQRLSAARPQLAADKQTSRQVAGGLCEHYTEEQRGGAAHSWPLEEQHCSRISAEETVDSDDTVTT